MENLIVSLSFFIVIYLAYVLFVINRKNKLEKLKKSANTIYLVKKYKLDLKQINFKILAHIIALSNAFIMSVTFFIISFIKNNYLKILVCFIIILPILYIMYMIIGKTYQKRGKCK